MHAYLDAARRRRLPLRSAQPMASLNSDQPTAWQASGSGAPDGGDFGTATLPDTPFMLSAGGGVAQFIVLALSPAIARLCFPEAFGVFAIYAALASLLAVVATGQYEKVLMLPRYHRQGACLLLFVILLCPVVALILGLPLVIFRSSLAVLIGEPRLAPCSAI